MLLSSNWGRPVRRRLDLGARRRTAKSGVVTAALTHTSASTIRMAFMIILQARWPAGSRGLGRNKGSVKDIQRADQASLNLPFCKAKKKLSFCSFRHHTVLSLGILTACQGLRPGPLPLSPRDNQYSRLIHHWFIPPQNSSGCLRMALSICGRGSAQGMLGYARVVLGVWDVALREFVMKTI